MKNLASRVLAGLAAGALAIATIVAMSWPAQAAVDNYTPHGGPGVSLLGSDVVFTVVEAGQTFTCEQFDLSGTLTGPDVSRPFGSTATTWDQLVFSGCTNPYFGATTFDLTGTWGFAITGPEVGSVSPAAITDVAMFVEMNGCSFNIAGEVSGDFDDATEVFTPTGSTLIIADDPVGFVCSSVGFTQGQSISVSGSWLITGLTISNP
ncbi:MAG: hypothetical protein ACRDPS_02875 [Nocardioides sp.]|uniref:hypothetical protein n=1 Tax=Nocardioides sp. TaxID=35761 RepID=UPI003D6C47C0